MQTTAAREPPRRCCGESTLKNSIAGSGTTLSSLPIDAHSHASARGDDCLLVIFSLAQVLSQAHLHQSTATSEIEIFDADAFVRIFPPGLLSQPNCLRENPVGRA